jgi:hypothetical protein
MLLRMPWLDSARILEIRNPTHEPKTQTRDPNPEIPRLKRETRNANAGNMLNRVMRMPSKIETRDLKTRKAKREKRNPKRESRQHAEPGNANAVARLSAHPPLARGQTPKNEIAVKLS